MDLIEQINHGAEMLVEAGFEPAGVVIHRNQRPEMLRVLQPYARITGSEGRVEIAGLPVYYSQEMYGPVVVSADVLRAMMMWSRSDLGLCADLVERAPVRNKRVIF